MVMIGLPGDSKIFMCSEPIDFRKGVEGLSLVADGLFPGDLLTGAYFVFLNGARNKIKVLFCDLDGFIIWYKRLEKGTFSPDLAKKQMDRRDFILLLEGVTPKKIRPRFQ